MKVDVINRNGQPAGRQVDLPDSIFGAEVNEHVLYLAVKQQRSAMRSGTHKAKEKGEVSGSTRKIKRQKGTGTARAGSIKSPLFRGGGRVFGPRPRSYDSKLNRKVVALAQRSALSSKMAGDGIRVIEEIDFEAPRTKSYVEFLNNLELSDKKSLLVVGEITENLYLCSRNINGAKVLQASELNVYDILNANTVLISEKAVDAITENLS